MILSFGSYATRDIFNGVETEAARKSCPKQLWKIAARKLELLDSAAKLHDLLIPPGNRLEKLHGDRQNLYSIRINQQYRICFVWSDQGPMDVQIMDYH